MFSVIGLPRQSRRLDFVIFHHIHCQVLEWCIFTKCYVIAGSASAASLDDYTILIKGQRNVTEKVSFFELPGVT